MFTPYADYNHKTLFLYDAVEYGELKLGTVVLTSRGLGCIINENIPEDNLPNFAIYEIYRLANEKEIKTFNKEWWSVILEIHEHLSNATTIENK